jgi:hypothetical protein
MEWRAGMEALSPSTINVRLSAVRKMVGEARRNNMIGPEEAASLTDIPNISQKGNCRARIRSRPFWPVLIEFHVNHSL